MAGELVYYECEVYRQRSTLLGHFGVENPPTNAFYFVIMVQNKIRQYYFLPGSSHWNFYNNIHESPHFSKQVVVKFDAIAEDEGAAFNPISEALGEADISTANHPQIIPNIHFKAARLAQEELGNTENGTVLIFVVITKVFIQIIDSPFGLDSDDDDEPELEEDEDTPFPLTESSIAALAKVTLDESGGECPICLEEMAADTEVTLLPCNHIFHGGCIANWLRLRNVCPLCRFRIPSAN